MKMCTIVPHTADIALNVEASTAEELFEAALLGMGGIVKRGVCRRGAPRAIREDISVRSPDQNSLLVDFLNEVLSLSHANKAVFCRVDISSLGDTALKAEVSGELVNGFDEDIKAATHHGAYIDTNDRGNLEVTVLFDI